MPHPEILIEQGLDEMRRKLGLGHPKRAAGAMMNFNMILTKYENDSTIVYYRIPHRSIGNPARVLVRCAFFAPTRSDLGWERGCGWALDLEPSSSAGRGR